MLTWQAFLAYGRFTTKVLSLLSAMDNQTQTPGLLVLIPAYNEEGAITDVIRGVRQAVPFACVLVVDDGSQDGTWQAAQAAGAHVVRHPINLGIGGAVQTGLKFAQQHCYELVIRLDGDGQHNPAEIPTLLNILLSRQADVVIASRFLSNDEVFAIPPGRRLGIALFALTVSLLTGRKATDTTSGFCGFNRRAVDTLAAFMPQDYPEVEGRVILHKAGLTTLEIPTQMRSRAAGVSSINRRRALYYAFKVSIAALLSALKVIPVISEKNDYGDTAGTTGYRRPLQPHFSVSDGPTDP